MCCPVRVINICDGFFIRQSDAFLAGETGG
jgi:hypothetical protein